MVSKCFISPIQGEIQFDEHQHMFQMNWNSQHFFDIHVFCALWSPWHFWGGYLSSSCFFQINNQQPQKLQSPNNFGCLAENTEGARSSLGLVRFGDERWSGNWQKNNKSWKQNTYKVCIYIYIYICLHRSFKPSPQTKMFVTCFLINSCHLGPKKSPRYYVNMKMAEVRGSSWGS